jgi:hypothetical protein
VVRTFEEFITVDVMCGDSDPVYYAVARTFQTKPNWTKRFCVAMLAYYHMGVALKAAEHEGNDFWQYLYSIYGVAPRGSERRHFRGAGGLKTLNAMAAWEKDPDKWFDRFGHTYASVALQVQNNFWGWGPYFVLKLCDYLDRCLDHPIENYIGLERNLPRSPIKALEAMFPGGTASYEFMNLCDRIQGLGLKACPDFTRPIGPAEVETSLCGWKTTKFGGNWFGADIDSKREELTQLGEAGRAMADLLPPSFPRDTFRCEL